MLDQAIYGKIFTIDYSAEQNFSMLHFKLDVFELQLKKRRRKQKHERSQIVLKKNSLVKVSWRVKNGCWKIHQRHHLETWLHQALISGNTAWTKSDFAVIGPWTNFSEPIDWLSAARSEQNSKKQVFRVSLQFFCYSTDGWTRCLCCSHIITLHFRIGSTNIYTQRF